jgi:hypothetical protein
MPLTVTLCKDAFLFSFLFNFSVTFSQKNTSSFEYRQLLRLNIGGKKKMKDTTSTSALPFLVLKL